MSAYLVSNSCINSIISFLAADETALACFPGQSPATLPKLGRALWALNKFALVERYGESASSFWEDRLEDYTPAFIETNAAEARDRIAELSYQCAEGRAVEEKLFQCLEPAQARMSEAVREEHARKLQFEREETARFAKIGEAWLAENKPDWAVGVLVADLHSSECDSQSDYWGSKRVETRVLAFTPTKRDGFAEMRKAAALFEGTCHLTEKEHEHREKYSMGHGYYLGQDRYSGWQVSKNCWSDYASEIGRAIEKGWKLPSVKPLTRMPKPAADPALRVVKTWDEVKANPSANKVQIGRQVWTITAHEMQERQEGITGECFRVKRGSKECCLERVHYALPGRDEFTRFALLGNSAFRRSIGYRALNESQIEFFSA